MHVSLRISKVYKILHKFWIKNEKKYIYKVLNAHTFVYRFRKCWVPKKDIGNTESWSANCVKSLIIGLLLESNSLYCHYISEFLSYFIWLFISVVLKSLLPNYGIQILKSFTHAHLTQQKSHVGLFAAHINYILLTRINLQIE